jgi:MoaA/NifB/PqqE/SkfB family radical SAM enzyme
MDKQQLADIVSNVSPTLCLAKFHDSTIWLYNNHISSCHHTPMVAAGTTPVTFYNPSEKRSQQKEMVKGQQPIECSYCWNLENNNVVSDRFKKSIDFKSHLLATEYLDPEFNFKPKSLELAFQNTCNLACSYCSTTFSNSWENDIRTHGNYEGITTDKRMHYQKGITPATPTDLALFWSWFDTVADGLETLRITGGEPLLHEETFDVIEKMQRINDKVRFTIATNLCQKPTVINRFIKNIEGLVIRVNVSNESAGPVAEFIRDGMNYNEWLENVRLLSNTNTEVCISTTITAISLLSMDQLFTDIINLRRTTLVKPFISVNFATYPEFQSVACLTHDERVFYLDKYTKYFDANKTMLLPTEIGMISRLLAMLRPDLTHPMQAEFRKDSDTFFEQYCKRRNKATNFATLIGDF